MKIRLISLLLVGCFVAVIITACGCCMCWGWRGQESYERTEKVSAEMTGAEQIAVDTSFGEVKITGAETAGCNVTAKITAQAPTAEEAKQLAEQTKIKLVTDGKTLSVKAEKPNLGNNRCISISYDIVIPAKTAVKCKSSYGKIELKNIDGNVLADTSFGKINAKNIAGCIKLETSYGEIDCRDITSTDFSAKSSFGRIDVEFSDACPADMSAKIETSYGEVEVDAPEHFAGSVVIETSFGKVKTDLPLTVKGELTKTRLTGSVGKGDGLLELKTSFGSIELK